MWGSQRGITNCKTAKINSAKTMIASFYALHISHQFLQMRPQFIVFATQKCQKLNSALNIYIGKK